MQHRYIITHGRAGQVTIWSGPFRTLDGARQALLASLAAGTLGIIEEEWAGRCRRCQECLVVGPGYFQHGCGEVYNYAHTL